MSHDPTHNRRAAQADPQDHAARFAALAQRARAEGPGVWLESLATLEQWVAQPEEAQDQAAEEVARRLGSGWVLRDVRRWDCRCYLIGSPSREDGTVEVKTIHHRLALFTHRATGMEFSLVPGRKQKLCGYHNSFSSSLYEFGEPPCTCEPALRPLLVAVWPVTRGQHSKMTGGRHNNHPWPGVIGSGGEHMPSTGLSRGAVIERLTLYGLRLPTAAEWSHAARGGAPTRFPWGDEVDLAHVWCAENSATRHGVGGGPCGVCHPDDGCRHSPPRGPRPHPPAEHDTAQKWNAFGLVDAYGNVSEFLDTGDIAGGNYTHTPNEIEIFAQRFAEHRDGVTTIGSRPVAGIPGLEGL